MNSHIHPFIKKLRKNIAQAGLNTPLMGSSALSVPLLCGKSVTSFSSYFEKLLYYTLATQCDNYCPFDIPWKDLFCLAFYFKRKCFVLIDHILSKPFVFSVSVFCSQIFTVKLNLQPKIDLTYAISIVK